MRLPSKRARDALARYVVVTGADTDHQQAHYSGFDRATADAIADRLRTHGVTDVSVRTYPPRHPRTP